MATFTADDGLGDLQFECEPIEITSNLPEPDKGWRFTDTNGHEHYWRDGYVTLVLVDDERYWCEDCGEDHVESHWECPLCGEHIEPRTVVYPYRRWMPGLRSWTLNGEPISEERAQQIIEARRARP